MSKKQTRQNRGARTGGHDRSATPDATEQTKTSTAPTTSQSAHPAPEASHKRSPKFGHN